MTGRVMLDLEDGQDVDGEWITDLIEWWLPWSTSMHARCRSLILLVATHHIAARAHGPHMWPTLAELQALLRGDQAEVTTLLTVAVAGGWLRYEDVAS
jgi:hypothetical protein